LYTEQRKLINIYKNGKGPDLFYSYYALWVLEKLKGPDLVEATRNSLLNTF